MYNVGNYFCRALESLQAEIFVCACNAFLELGVANNEFCVVLVCEIQA